MRVRKKFLDFLELGGGLNGSNWGSFSDGAAGVEFIFQFGLESIDGLGQFCQIVTAHIQLLYRPGLEQGRAEGLIDQCSQFAVFSLHVVYGFEHAFGKFDDFYGVEGLVLAEVAEEGAHLFEV